MNYKEQIEKMAIENTRSDLFFLSDKDLDGEELTPRVPDNYFTRNGYEDNETGRVCFSPSIDQALMGISQRMKGMELYVYKPSDIDALNIRKPTLKQVPDSAITGETWSLSPTKIKGVGKIVVGDDKGLDGHKFKYGDKEAELYDWNWDWKERGDDE